MKYTLDKLTYATWYRAHFKDVPDPNLIDAKSTVILELDGTSKLTPPSEKIVYVHVVAGSVGVPLRMEFAVAKQYLIPLEKRP